MTLSSADIRLASGIVAPNTLLTTDSYLVTNWSRVSDMPASIDWTVSQSDKGAQRRFSPSLSLGSGKRLGKYSTLLSFFQLTTLMRSYIEDTILSGNGIGVVTAYVATPNDSEVFAVYTGELTSPYHLESDLSYTRVTDELDVNVQYQLSRLTLTTISVLSVGSNMVLVDELDRYFYVG